MRKIQVNIEVIGNYYPNMIKAVKFTQVIYFVLTERKHEISAQIK